MRSAFTAIFILFFGLLVFGADSSVVSGFLRKLEASITPCECTVSAISPEAVEKPLGKSTLKDLHGRTIPITVMNDEFAIKIFQEMTVQGKIPFGFPEDGCYARAHEMARLLEKRKVLTAKVFALGKFRIDTEKAKNGSVTWGFHVAPVIEVDDGKEKHLWVIDPSLFYEPVSLEAWLKSLTSHPKSQLNEVFLTSRFIYHPNHRDRVLNDYRSEDVKSAETIMKKYLKRDQERIKESLGSL